jgi:hypothetical protein
MRNKSSSSKMNGNSIRHNRYNGLRAAAACLTLLGAAACSSTVGEKKTSSQTTEHSNITTPPTTKAPTPTTIPSTEASFPTPKGNLCDSVVIKTLIANEMLTDPSNITCTNTANIQPSSLLISNMWQNISNSSEQVQVTIEANVGESVNPSDYWPKLVSEINSGQNPSSFIAYTNSINGRPAIMNSGILSTLYTNNEVIEASATLPSSQIPGSSNEDFQRQLISTIETTEF